MIDLEQLQELSTAKSYSKNTIIIREKDKEPYCMYIILQGNVRIVKNYGAVDQVLITQLGPGDFFGEMSLFLLKPRAATVITSSEETVVLEINQMNAYSIIENNSELLYKIVKTLCERIDYLNGKVPPRYGQGMLT
ncbi:MAG: cyclic nucleotide-binding domain-containing protein [Defluviitaleaceae bacterium]|nr:cyclic nucleotide-binding domain-containing protein [Defluviitaleaceae bacterium]